MTTRRLAVPALILAVSMAGCGASARESSQAALNQLGYAAMKYRLDNKSWPAPGGSRFWIELHRTGYVKDVRVLDAANPDAATARSCAYAGPAAPSRLPADPGLTDSLMGAERSGEGDGAVTVSLDGRGEFLSWERIKRGATGPVKIGTAGSLFADLAE